VSVNGDCGARFHGIEQSLGFLIRGGVEVVVHAKTLRGGDPGGEAI